MRLVFLAAAAFALTACLQQTAVRTNPTVCNAAANNVWNPEGGGEFSIAANTSGPDCERAVATLVIRDGEGRVAWAEAYPTEHVMVLADAGDAGAMEAALSSWIDPEANTMQSTSALPEWLASANAPQSGEFPFYPEPEFDREGYAALRTSDVPLYCFVQGMESMSCLALSNGRLEKVGVQLFPG